MGIIISHSLLMDLRLRTWMAVIMMMVTITTTRSTVPPATLPMMMYCIGNDCWISCPTVGDTGWVGRSMSEEKIEKNRNVLSSSLMNIEVLCYKKATKYAVIDKINNNLGKTPTNIIILRACKECTILWNSYIVHLRYTDYSTKYSPWCNASDGVNYTQAWITY